MKSLSLTIFPALLAPIAFVVGRCYVAAPISGVGVPLFPKLGRRRSTALPWWVTVFYLLVLPGFAQEVDKPATHPRLLLSAITAKPGETIWAGIEMTMDPDWHIYWRNPGVGIPPSAVWTLPPGVTTGDMLWPPPVKSATVVPDTPPIYTYEYRDHVVLLAPLHLAPDLKPGLVKMSAVVSWLECKVSCSPRQTSIAAELTIADEDKPSPSAALLEQWRAQLPANSTNLAVAQWDGPVTEGSRGIIIDFKAPNRAGDFYPYEQQAAEIQGATENLTGEPGRVRLRKVVKKGDGPWPDQFTGLFVTTNAAQNRVALIATIPVQGAASGNSTAALPLELLIAFLAGLILNVMPCILPVIALKVLGFVNQSKEAPERVKRLGLIYGLGVLVSFAVLAVLAVAAQKAGGDAGWGSALRHPQFRVALTVLMTLIALNLFGLFEVTVSAGVAGSAAGLASRQGYGGAFFNGMLATLLATPCTAPYLAGALAFAFSQPAGVTLAVFLAIGLGLAFPFVLVCWNPRLLKALPKPGAWMEKFKIAMGFPMLGTALWLAYSSTKNQTDMLLLEFFLGTVALAAWIWGQFVQRGTRHRGLAALLCLLLAGAGYFAILPRSSASGIDWKPWSPEAVEQARKEGHPVLVDFTAKTCLTCIANKASSIEIEQTRAKLRQIGAVSLVADFTDEDPAMAGELKKWQGTASVPLVLVYPKDPSRGPEVLPTLLTPGIVLKALDQAVE
jgi:thiol:disulfide interchange protein DsbD